MVVAPFPDSASSGGLSIHGDTHISVSILNDSPITVDQKFSVHILFDDVVVERVNYAGSLGGELLSFDWGDLGSTVPITAGLHTLKLIVDPTGIVAESDETDNSFEIELAWRADAPLVAPEPLPTPAASTRPSQALANLTGYIAYGWDAAISVSREADGLDAGRGGQLGASALQVPLDTLHPRAAYGNDALSVALAGHAGGALCDGDILHIQPRQL